METDTSTLRKILSWGFSGVVGSALIAIGVYLWTAPEDTQDEPPPAAAISAPSLRPFPQVPVIIRDSLPRPLQITPVNQTIMVRRDRTSRIIFLADGAMEYPGRAPVDLAYHISVTSEVPCMPVAVLGDLDEQEVRGVAGSTFKVPMETTNSYEVLVWIPDWYEHDEVELVVKVILGDRPVVEDPSNKQRTLDCFSTT